MVRGRRGAARRGRRNDDRSIRAKALPPLVAMRSRKASATIAAGVVEARRGSGEEAWRLTASVDGRRRLTAQSDRRRVEVACQRGATNAEVWIGARGAPMEEVRRQREAAGDEAAWRERRANGSGRRPSEEEPGCGAASQDEG